MAVTPNYGWPVPVATDYVKDGWEAISDLGNAIDTTVATLPTESMTLISTTTLSGSGVLLSSIPQTYKDLYIVVRNFLGSSAAWLQLRINNDSTANRHRAYNVNDVNASPFNDTLWVLTGGANNNTTSQGLTFVKIVDYTNTTTWTVGDSLSVGNNSTTSTQIQVRRGVGVYNQTSAVTSLYFFPDVGTFTSGTILLYGVK